MENEIKVGEYCRTKDGIIDKVIIDYKGKCNNPNCNRKHISCEKNYYNEDEIVKHSPNLIDIIEAGDYVNGNMVIDKPTKKWLNVCTNIVGNSRVYDWGIKSIVTKEQLASVSYKVKE